MKVFVHMSRALCAGKREFLLFRRFMNMHKYLGCMKLVDFLLNSVRLGFESNSKIGYFTCFYFSDKTA